MNPEIMYPELKEMKNDEIFVEWAYVIRPSGVLKLHVATMIQKKAKDTFVRALKQKYGEEEIELVTIFR